MQVHEMRKALMQMYGGSAKWQAKVKKMSDSQVMAIYLRLQRKG